MCKLSCTLVGRASEEFRNLLWSPTLICRDAHQSSSVPLRAQHTILSIFKWDDSKQHTICRDQNFFSGCFFNLRSLIFLLLSVYNNQREATIKWNFGFKNYRSLWHLNLVFPSSWLEYSPFLQRLWGSNALKSELRWGILIRPIYFTVLKHQGDITQIFIWTWWSTQISQNSTDALGEKTLIYHFCSSQKHFLAMFKYTRAMRSNDFVLWGCNCASPQIEKRTLDFHTPWENYWRIENRWPFLGIRHKPAVDINPSYGQVKRLSCISLLSRWKTCLSARNKLCEMKELMLLLCMKNNTYIDGVPFFIYICVLL